MTKPKQGFAPINGAELAYEVAGSGPPFVMIHAGVADKRQWNDQIDHFAQNYTVIRYDMRGYGSSEPAEGEYRNLEDLRALLDYLKVTEPIILMGCSIGGMLSMDFSLAHPERVKALIMVCSQPRGYMPPAQSSSDLEERAYAAWEAGNIAETAELETRFWFNGPDAPANTINQQARERAYAMDLQALTHEAKKLGTRLPDTETKANEQLDQLKLPVLVVIGQYDPEPHASDYMVETLPNASKLYIENAAHLPNMSQPAVFNEGVTTFLETAFK